jgi:hypothetical protein
MMISPQLCSSMNDTSHIVTQLSKEIKAGLLPEKFHLVSRGLPMYCIRIVSLERMEPANRDRDFSLVLDFKSVTNTGVGFQTALCRGGALWYASRLLR